VQKKCYKVLAYLCEQRPDFLQAHFQQVVSALADARAASLSAAKRNRLRCLKAVVLAMARPKGPELEAGEEEGTSREEATKQVRLTGVLQQFWEASSWRGHQPVLDIPPTPAQRISHAPAPICLPSTSPGF
jgi:hypothetical protein